MKAMVVCVHRIRIGLRRRLDDSRRVVQGFVDKRPGQSLQVFELKNPRR
jgi:hypothetical protein